MQWLLKRRQSWISEDHWGILYLLLVLSLLAVSTKSLPVDGTIIAFPVLTLFVLVKTRKELLSWLAIRRENLEG